MGARHGELLARALMDVEKLESPEIGSWKVLKCAGPAGGMCWALYGAELFHLFSAFLKESGVWWQLNSPREVAF